MGSRGHYENVWGVEEGWRPDLDERILRETYESENLGVSDLLGVLCLLYSLCELWGEA